MELIESISQACKCVQINEPMKHHTTFKIGGCADILCEPETTEELRNILMIAKQNNIKPMIIGNGSNLLVSDKGIRGIVIKIGDKMNDVRVDGEMITAGAGAKLKKISNAAQQSSLTGFECLSGIPGSFGGAIYMNAGAYGAEIADIIVEVSAMTADGELITIKKEDMQLGYRNSIFMHSDLVIVSGVIKLCTGEREKIDEKIRETTIARTTKQPLEMPSAGSVFKRPEGYFAGKLIEDCDLKGYSIGGAMISPKHAGFIVNYDNATAQDVVDLIKYTQDKVLEKFGVEIEPEIRLTGEK